LFAPTTGTVFEQAEDSLVVSWTLYGDVPRAFQVTASFAFIPESIVWAWEICTVVLAKLEFTVTDAAAHVVAAGVPVLLSFTRTENVDEETRPAAV
jgi:hypothetical protein